MHQVMPCTCSTVAATATTSGRPAYKMFISYKDLMVCSCVGPVGEAASETLQLPPGLAATSELVYTAKPCCTPALALVIPAAAAAGSKRCSALLLCCALSRETLLLGSLAATADEMPGCCCTALLLTACSLSCCALLCHASNQCSETSDDASGRTGCPTADTAAGLPDCISCCCCCCMIGSSCLATPAATAAAAAWLGGYVPASLAVVL